MNNKQKLIKNNKLHKTVKARFVVIDAFGIYRTEYKGTPITVTQKIEDFLSPKKAKKIKKKLNKIKQKQQGLMSFQDPIYLITANSLIQEKSST